MSIYNFAAGPAMLPIPVMKQIQDEWINWNGMGVSVIEISHRSKEFEALLAENDELIREVADLPDDFEILYTHGGAQMQFSMVPMNLLGLKPGNIAQYIETGNFASIARKEAEKFGHIEIIATGEADNFSKLPDLDQVNWDQNASYVHITSNNTLFGTQWKAYPDLGETPLVIDATSDIFSKPIDWSRVGLMYGGAQKNLGPSGLALALVRKDLLGKATQPCPKLMDYSVYAGNHSMANTPNTFALYALNLIMKWIKAEGGLSVMEERNQTKAKTIYEVIDGSDFYQGTAQEADRSIMNVTFTLPSDEMLQEFLKESQAAGLYALKGHRVVGGARASIYNPMPQEGVDALASFMKFFAQKRG